MRDTHKNLETKSITCLVVGFPEKWTGGHKIFFLFMIVWELWLITKEK